MKLPGLSPIEKVNLDALLFDSVDHGLLMSVANVIIPKFSRIFSQILFSRPWKTFSFSSGVMVLVFRRCRSL